MSSVTNIMFAILVYMTSHLAAEPANVQKSIRWLTNYEEATNKAKASSKPILLFFTGSDWCRWCSKLEKEVFDAPEFAKLSSDEYVFLKLDFPLYSALAPQQSAQNKQLQKKFDVRSYPTLVILDSTAQQKIGVTGYRPGGEVQYAHHIEKMVNNYSSYKEKLKRTYSETLTGQELRKLYETSKELHLPNDTSYLVKLGMNSDLKKFFLTERYRFLADEGLIRDKEAVSVKEQLLALDPDNKQHAHYDLAVIEFEAFSEEQGRSNDLAVLPLLEYIEKFGAQDKENLWRLEMIISQVFLDKNQLSPALKHAQASYDASPPSVKGEIALAIKSIQSQLDDN